MNALLVLIPLALAMGLGALGLFLWSLRARQYEDLDGAAQRILFDDKDGPAR
jgi:cbb3-type cytochrome oxidase maturation protein